jgi:hypothetical protein
MSDDTIILSDTDKRAGWIAIEKRGDIVQHHRIGCTKGQAHEAITVAQGRWPNHTVTAPGYGDSV